LLIVRAAGRCFPTRQHPIPRSDLQHASAQYTTTIGTLLNPSNITREMAPLMAAAGVPRIRFHDLRHTCASLMLARGVPVHVVSRQLGHANVAITMNVYAHLMPGQGAAAAEVLRRALAGEG
jgi:integrase